MEWIELAGDATCRMVIEAYFPSEPQLRLLKTVYKEELDEVRPAKEWVERVTRTANIKFGR